MDEHRPVHMFSTHENLKQRKGKAMDRFPFLQKLVTEYQDTENQVAKEQCIAHLANFSYDPINYDWLRKLHVIDLFLDALTETSEKLKEYGIGGLCNLCLDWRNAKIIIDNKGIPLIIKTLSSANEETVLSAITTLVYLLSSKTKKDIGSKPVRDCMKKYASSKNPRLKNLATVFLEDIEQVA